MRGAYRSHALVLNLDPGDRLDRFIYLFYASRSLRFQIYGTEGRHAGAVASNPMAKSKLKGGPAPATFYRRPP